MAHAAGVAKAPLHRSGEGLGWGLPMFVAYILSDLTIAAMGMHKHICTHRVAS